MYRSWSILLSLLLCFELISKLDGKYVAKIPECACDGTDWFVEAAQFSSLVCGRYAMCSFDIHYYLINMPGVVLPPGFKSAAEYENIYTTIMSSFGYPLELSVDYMIDDCKAGYRSCTKEKELLIFSECDRLRPQKEKEWANLPRKGPYKGPIFYRPNPYKINKNDWNSNGWRMVLDSTGFERPSKFKPLDNKYVWGACPHYIHRPTFTMGALLWEFAKVQFHEDLAPHYLLGLLRPYIIRAMHCRIFAMKYDILYYIYNATEFCNDWNVSSTYACIVLHEYPSDREQRDVVKECGAPPLPENHEQQIDYTDQLYADGIGKHLPNFVDLTGKDKDYPEKF